MSSSNKRRRSDEEEACEALGGLLRQTAARAVERVRLQRQQRTGAVGGGGVGLTVLSSSTAEAVARTTKPMDVLVIRFCMFYLDCSGVAGPTQFVRLAQEVVTTSVERLLIPQLFTKGGVSLPALCESLVAEHTADEMQTAVKEVNEFVEARGGLGAWLAEAADAARHASMDEDEGSEQRYDDDGWPSVVDDEGGHASAQMKEEDRGDDDGYSEPVSFERQDDFALATTLYKACEFWVRVQAFLNALSLHSARLHVFKMPPRYERELLLVLYNATRGREDSGSPASAVDKRDSLAPSLTAGEGRTDAAAVTTLSEGGLAVAKHEEDQPVKKEPIWEGDVAEDENAALMGGDVGEQQPSPTPPPQQLYKASALLGDLLALSRCPGQSPTESAAATAPSRVTSAVSKQLAGMNPDFYKMVYARLGVMVARDRLHRFDQSCSVQPPPLTVQQRNIHEQLQQQQQQLAAAAAVSPAASAMDAGLPTTYVPDDAYFDKLLHQQHDTVEEDEEVYKGEVMDYYLTHPGRYASTTNGGSSAASRNRSRGGAKDGEPPLMKPHRFCKVKTGFSWTQYNRTHYDSRTNPPPRTEMWYEFTLFYPALANTKRDMRKIFRIEDAPEGPNDQYCLLVFSVGPPYADVAYRIRKKQWDTRPGGVRISFDQTGRYKLFFRFTNSNYRR